MERAEEISAITPTDRSVLILLGMQPRSLPCCWERAVHLRHRFGGEKRNFDGARSFTFRLIMYGGSLELVLGRGVYDGLFSFVRCSGAESPEMRNIPFGHLMDRCMSEDERGQFVCSGECVLVIQIVTQWFVDGGVSVESGERNRMSIL